MTKQKDTDRELSLMVKEMVDGTTDELKSNIPTIDLSPEIPDARVKQAILEVSPAGMEKLFGRFGREQVMNFIGEFSEGRKF